jgi:hypothetical protein
MSWMAQSNHLKIEPEETKTNMISEILMKKGFENDPFRIISN